MARPSYTAIAAGEIDVDTALRASTMRTLRPNTDHARLAFLTVHDGRAASDRSTATAWTATGTDFRIWIPDLPDYSGGGISRVLWGLLHVCRGQGAGAGTAEVRVRDVGSTNLSSAGVSTVDAATSWPTPPSDMQEVSIAVPASWQNTVRTLEIQSRKTGAAVYAFTMAFNDPWVLEY